MSATMARQGGRIQLAQSDMRLVLNMAKMAKEGVSRAAIEETKYRIKKTRAEVREEKQQGVEFPGHNKVKAAIQRHPGMLRYNQTSGSPPCQNPAANNLQTLWRLTGTGTPLPARRRVRTREPTPPPPGTPPVPTSKTSGAQPSEIVNLPAGYTNSHKALPSAEFFEDDEDTEHHTDFDLDMLADDG
jgi:hypothetical protein